MEDGFQRAVRGGGGDRAGGKGMGKEGDTTGEGHGIEDHRDGGWHDEGFDRM